MARRRLVQLLLIFVFTFAAPQTDIGTKTVVLKKFAQCGGSGGSGNGGGGDTRGKLRVFVEDVIIAVGGSGRQSLSARFDVKEDIKNQFNLKLDLRKCDVNGNPDHCEYVIRNHNLPDICDLVSSKGETLTIFIENIEKKLECPIKKDIYNLTKTTITNEMLAFVPFANALWKFRLTGFETETMILCVELEVLVKMTRPRRGRGRRQ